MELVIPEGAQVHITIGQSPLLALPNATAPETAAMPDPPPRRAGRPLLKATLVMVLLVGAFLVGRHIPLQTSLASRPALAMGVPPTPGGQPAFPDHALPRPSAATTPAPQVPDQVPASFAQQLRQAPKIVPAPGQPVRRGPAPAANPFGLHE